jgi:hypothetical protein
MWGLVATVTMTAFLLVVWRVWPNHVAQPLPLAITIGIVAKVFHTGPLALGTVLVGMLMQLIYGAIWGGLFETGTERVTPGKGIWLGLGLWLLMMVFYLPMAGIAVFNMATSAGIWISSLLGHIVYGATLGALLARDQRQLPLPREPVGIAG